MSKPAIKVECPLVKATDIEFWFNGENILQSNRDVKKIEFIVEVGEIPQLIIHRMPPPLGKES
jgi:hypothetical protein